jgi:predicted dinucleotide-binding enzyme
MHKQRRTLFKLVAALAAGAGLNAFGLAARAAGADANRMKIGLVGTGRVGGTLATVWAKAGHELLLSSRNLDDDRVLAAKLGAAVRAGTTREAAAFGDVVLISVPYGAMPELGKTLGDLLKGKIVIDTSNPFENRDGEIAKWAREKGAGLATAELLPGARIVRAFNAIGYMRMGAAHEQPGRIGMPIASDDAQAVEIASRLIRDIGYEPVLIGGLAMGRYLIPGTPLAGERSAEEIRKIVATLK